ncbi:MAG TPA: site-specific DNA-methyltransferase [Candidatus Hydrogenedentes bacterium]|nr:site-specific DNA-methyltransferase [Candidatus Hydrogenedentota bacterium]
MAQIEVYFGDNLPVLRSLPPASVAMVYIDPPFNTGRRQSRTQIATVRDANGDRTGFQGRRYRTVKMGATGYEDAFEDYLAFLEPRLVEAHRILREDGSLFFHIDYREAHYCKILLDRIFGRESFLNEIIWAYDYGARSKKRWSPKHDTIFWYAKDPSRYVFHFDAIDRIPYMAPDLVGRDKAARGKTPTDVWWHTIVSPTGKEKTGYATQKPRGVIDRLMRVHTSRGDLVCDFFAGSGTVGESAAF